MERILKMMTNPPYRAIVIAAVLVLLLGSIGLYFLGKKIEDKIAEVRYEVVHKPSQEWRDSSGISHSRGESVVVRDPELVSELQDLAGEFSELKKNMKNFNSYTSAGIGTTINKTVVITDSVFKYTSRYDTITGRIHGDSIDFKIKVTDTLKIVEYWDRKYPWPFGRKKSKYEITNSNPSNEILFSQKIEKKRQRGLFNKE